MLSQKKQVADTWTLLQLSQVCATLEIYKILESKNIYYCYEVASGYSIADIVVTGDSPPLSSHPGHCRH
jgi:hypothetical protein